MNRLLLSILLSLSLVLGANAQSDSLGNFHFVYIDHEPTTPVVKLCERIIKLYSDAKENSQPLIVYLSNGDEPYLVTANLASADSTAQDTDAAFYQLIDELQRSVYHEVDEKADRTHVDALIGPEGKWPLFVGDTMVYKSVTLDFYIGKRFWNLYYNEEIIARLFLSLNISKFWDRYPRTQLAFNVFKAKGEQLHYSEGNPFGMHNYENINSKLSVFEY